MKRSFSFSLRLTAFCIAMIFSWNQIAWAGEILPQDHIASSTQPIATVSASAPVASTATTPVQTFTTIDFLADKQGPLSPVTQDTFGIVPKPAVFPDATHYEYKHYDFQDALDLLRPEFASAVIVKKITAEDLKKLAGLSFETGVIILHGEIVLFTSGNEEELGILSAANRLIQKATFVSHTHPGTHAEGGPSEFDLARAGSEEFVITTAGVYAYDRTGFLNEGEIYSYDEYIGKLNQTVRDSLNERNQVDARKDLNEFIVEQDLYNGSADREIFRRATLAPTVQYFYNSTGNMIRTLTTTYYESGKVESVDDCRFLAGLKTNRYYTTYDPAGIKTHYITTTYQLDGQTAKVIKDEYYTGGVKAGYSQLTYDIAGVKTQDYNVTYYSNGTTPRSVDDYRYASGLKTYFYQTSYDSAGLKTHYTATTYHSDGQAVKVLADYSYTAGIKTSYDQVTYDVAGVKTQDYNVTYYSNGTTPKTVDDSRYASGLKTYFYQTSYDSAGLKTHYTATTYHPDGQAVKVFADYAYIAGLKTGYDQVTYDPAGMKTRDYNVTYYADGVTAKTIDDSQYANGIRISLYQTAYYYTDGVKTGYTQVTYDASGSKTRDYAVTYYSNGTIPKTADDSRYANGFRTYFYQTTYDSEGLKTRYTVTTYHPDGQAIKTFSDYSYSASVKTAYSQMAYDTAGVKTQDYNATYYPNGTTPKTVDDYRYASGLRTYFYQTNYDLEGLKTHYAATTYHSDGQAVKVLGDYSYSAGIKTVYNQVIYDIARAKTQDYSVTYYPNGTTPKTVDDYRYTSGLKTYFYQTAYDPAGIRTHYCKTTYQANGVAIRSMEDLWYAGSIKTQRYYTTFDASGLRTHLLLQTFYADGRVKTSDDYSYAVARLTKRIFKEYDASSVELRSLTENYPPEILTNNQSYAIRYVVDGNGYEETLSLAEGSNFLQKSVSGYNNESVLIEWKITLDTVPPEIIFTSSTITNSKNYTLTYAADGIVKTQVFTNLAEGENTLSVTEADAAGNQSIANWNVKVDTIPPEIVVTSPVPSLTKNPTLVVDYTVDGAVKQKTFTLAEGDNLFLVITELDNATNSATITLPNVTLDTIAPAIAIDPTTPISASEDSLTVYYTVDGVAKEKLFILTEGENALTITETDLAGNISALTHRVTYMPPASIPFPVLEFRSPQITTESSYELVYAVDGTEKREIYALQEGANFLTIEEPNAAGKLIAHYLVLRNAIADPVFPAKETELIFNLNGTDAALVDPSFDASGLIQAGWIKSKNGTAYRLSGGLLAEEFRSDGTHIYYDSLGRIHSQINKSGRISNYQYKVNAAGDLLSAHIEEGNDRVDLDRNGFTLFWEKGDGTEFFFDAGRLTKIKKDTVEYPYQFRQAGGEWLSESIDPLPSDFPYPASLHYTSGLALSQAVMPGGTVYQFDLSGAVTRVVDPAGKETLYDPKEDLFGVFDAFSVTRDSMTRVYGGQGKLTQLKDADGTVFAIDQDRVVTIQKADGTLYRDLAYDAAGNLQNALVKLADGRELLIVGQQLRQIKSSDGTILEIQNDRPARSLTTDGRVYQYHESTDASGNAVFTGDLTEFINDKGNHVFVANGRVNGMEETRNGVLIRTGFAYDGAGRIVEAVIDQDGIRTARFVYDYPTSGTVVMNAPGSIRYYDPSGKLMKLTTPRGEEYTFGQATDPNGAAGVFQTLVKIASQLEGTIDYQNGKPVRIVRPDSIEIKDIVLNPDDSLLSAVLIYPNGEKGLIEAGELKQIIGTDGTKKEYAAGLLQKIILPTFETANFSYAFDASNNVSSITVQDGSGSRTYMAAGILSSAVNPGGDIFTYDAAENLIRVKTSANEEFNYSGKTLSSIKFSTGEMLTGMVLNANGSLSSGTYDPKDGSIWTITNGAITQIRDASGNNLYYSGGHVTQIVKVNGDRITYDASGQITQITWADGSSARQITANSQDALVNAIIYSPSFDNTVLSTTLSGIGSNERPLLNGILQTPGSQVRTAGKFFDFNGLYWRDINSTTLRGSDQNYIRIKMTGSNFTVGYYATNLSYSLFSQQAYPFAAGSPYVYVPLPDLSTGYIYAIQISPRSNVTVDITDTPLVFSSGNYQPAAWVNTAITFSNQKTAPGFPERITVALSKKTALEGTSQDFSIAETFNAVKVSDGQFQIETLKNAALQARLSPNTVLSAVYDRDMNLLSAVHNDPVFDPSTDANGEWKNAVSGWEEDGFEFAPVVTAPRGDVPLKIEYASNGESQTVSFQNASQAIYQNDRIETVITPEGKTVHYSYAAGSSDVDRVIFDPDQIDPETTEVKYEYGKIREIRKAGVLVYRYSYEFDELGDEITVIEDTVENQIRRFLKGKLISINNLNSGFKTVYDYDGSGRIAKAVTSRSGRIFGSFAYAYSGDDTLITEETTGISRRYGADGFLKELITAKGEFYKYSILSDGQSEDLLLQELVKIVDSRGTIQYSKEKPIEITAVDGTVIKNLIVESFVDENHITRMVIQRAEVHLPAPDGRVVLIENGKVFYMGSSGGEIQEFENGFLERLVNAQGEITDLIYTRNVSGEMESIAVADKNGQRIYDKNGQLIRAVLLDTTQIDYDGSGRLLRLETPGGEIWEYSAGSLNSVTLAGGGGKIEQIVLNASGAVQSCVYTKDGIVTTIQDGAVASKKTLDGTLFIYAASGKVAEIRKPVGAGYERLIYDANGVLTAIERADGSRARHITVDSQDNLVNAIIYSPSFDGAVLNATFPEIGANERPLVNGTLQIPGAQAGIAGNFFDFNGLCWRDVNASLHGSDKNYIRIKMAGSAVTFNYYASNYTSSLFSQQTYQSAIGSPYVYIPLPDLSTNYIYAIEISPRWYVTMDTADTPLIFSRGDMPATDWTTIASGFVGQKERPEVLATINDAFLKKATFESQATVQFSLRSPAQLDEGQAQTFYDATLGTVGGVMLEPETIIAAAYRASDSKLLMAARANNTVAHYVEAQIDYVTDLDGNLLIDHEYDAEGDLIAVHLMDAKKKLEEQIIAAQTQVSRQETEALMALAVKRGHAIEAIRNKLNEGLAAINAERERIRQLGRQRVCHKILFFKSCEDVQVDVSAPLSELDQMEKDLREETAGALAGLDTVVAQKKTEIETDARAAFVELEKQQLATYREILKQELRPVLFHHYRKILGRDPSEGEINAWLEREIGDDSVSLFSFEKAMEARGLNFTGAWVDLDRLKVLLGLSQTGVLASLKDVGFVMVTDVSGGIVTFVQRSLGNRTQELKIELVPWLDANGVPIPDVGGNVIYVEKYVFVPKDDGFGGEKITVTESEFLNRWLKENSLQGAAFTDQPLAPGSVLITDEEANAIPGLSSWDILVEYFKSAFRIDLEQANVSKLTGELSGSEEYSVRLAQVNAIKAAVRDFLNQYLVSDETERSAKILSLGLVPEEVISVTTPEIETILAWLDSRDLHFGHSAFFAIQHLIEEGNVQASLFDIAREVILIDIMTGVIHPLTTGDLELSLFALNRAAKNRNVLLTPAKVAFEELKREVGLGKGVLVHMNGNHYVVVTKIELAAQTDENGDPVLDEQGAPVMVEVVTYIEKNVGPSGEAQTLARSEFEKIWAVTAEGEGIVLTPAQVSNNAKIMTDRETQQVTGAFFGFIFGILKKIFDVVIQVVKAVFEAVKTVLRYVINLVVDVVRSLTDFVLELGKSLVSLGQFFFEAIRFVGAILSGDLNGGFQSLQRALGNFGNFLFFAGVGFFGGLGPLQVIGFQVLSIVLSKGTGVVLDKLGIKSPVIKNLIGSFITGGVFGFIGGQIGLGTTFLNSAVANLAMSGVNELALHIGLPPPIATNLGILSSIITGSVESGASLPEAFKTVAPDLMKELTLSGIWAFGNALGIDPRLTSLLSLPLGAGVGVGFDSLLHANTINFTSLTAAIKNGLATGLKSIGFNFSGSTNHPIFGSLLSGNVLTSIGSAMGNGSFFSGILDILKTAILAPFNIVNDVIQTSLQGIRDFASLIQEKGLAGALGLLVTSIFSRQTIEKLLGFGGIGGFVGSAAKSLTTLANGQQVQEQKVDGSTSLYYDLVGNFIGKKENGVTQLGTFGFDAAGKWALLSGQVFSPLAGGLAFAGEVADGQLRNGRLYDQNGNIAGEFNPEGGQSTIVIDDRDSQNPSGGAFWSGVFNLAALGLQFLFQNGILKNVDVRIQTGSTGTESGASTNALYVLTNGINNPQASVWVPPDYVRNLSADLVSKNNSTILPSDILTTPIYLKQFDGNIVDSFKDVLSWAAESQLPENQLFLVSQIKGMLAAAFALRPGDMEKPIIGMGFSGGFLPLLETITQTNYSFNSLVGIGAATLSLTKDVVDAILKSIDLVLSKTIDGLELLLQKIGIGYVLNPVVEFLQQGLIDPAMNLLISAISQITKTIPSTLQLPSLAGTGVEMLVNVYGTNDILIKTGIAGYRQELSGFSVNDEDHPLFNVEIKNCGHSNYFTRDNPTLNMPAVNDFVTSLLQKSTDIITLQALLLKYVDGPDANGVWVIDLGL